jgi:fructoselysine-6-P-deglycase FrlB-like protein
MSITTEQITSIPELQRVIDHWEDECVANPDSARHYWLRKAIDEIRGLGY